MSIFASQMFARTGENIGKAFLVENADVEFNQAPRLQVLDASSLVLSTTVNRAKLNTNLLRGDLPDWAPGVEPVGARIREYDSYTVNLTGKQTPTESKPRGLKASNYIMDMSNAGPEHLSIAYQLIQWKTYGFFTGSTHNAETFSAAGTLDLHAADATPLTDIRATIKARNYRPLTRFTGLELEGRMDEDTLDVLSANREYTGAGEGSNNPVQLDPEPFLTIFKSKHRLKKVTVFEGIRDTAYDGQTSSLSTMVVMGRYLWIGLVDRSKSEFRAIDQKSMDSPEGSYAIAYGRKPTLAIWDDGPKYETVGLQVRFNFEILNPRYRATGGKMGSVWPTGQIHA